VVHADPAVPTAAVSVWYRVGSADEPPARSGLAHLFEHLFKSSPERLGGHHYEILKRAGATDANASTSSERTAYQEVVPAHQLDLALWLESERMGYFPAGLTPARLAAQQAVVRAERRQRYEDVAYGRERLAVAAALYPEGHPLRHLTIGSHEGIQAATVDDVLEFYRTWYAPANATLVIAGDVGDAAEVDARVDRYFGTFPASARPARPAPAAPRIQRAALQVEDRFAALPRVHRVWRAPAVGQVGEIELEVLAAGWSTLGMGALWRRLVYEAPIAHRVAAWAASGRLGGELHVVVDLRTGADPAVVRAILDEECARGLDARAIERVVTRREASVVWSLTTALRRAQHVQRALLYGDEPDALAAELARYRAVTPGAIAEALRAWVTPDQLIDVETVPARPRDDGSPAATAPAAPIA
jgi:predicted Zn-dependent peptidase